MFDPLPPPSADEVEVTVFGPGYGECILVHVGEGRWLCIDSCLSPDNGPAVALKYFKSLGISPTSLIAVVATHWDTDHIRGLHQVLEAAPNAKFVVSCAFGNKEFRKAIAPYIVDGRIIPNSSTDEIDLAFKIIEKTGRKKKLILASASKPLIEEDPVNVRSLSPSDHAVFSAIARLHEQKGGGFARNMPRLSPNDSSVALRIRIGKRYLLFGADLEMRADRSLGWLAIVDQLRDQNKAEFFKVPHHGSPNGDDDEIWSTLLEKEVHTVVTPFVCGRTKRPSEDDQHRLKQRTPNLWLTAPPQAKKLKGLSREIERTMRAGARSVEFTRKRFGYVRLRTPMRGGAWAIETFGDALPLRQ